VPAIDKFLHQLCKLEGSDLHLTTGRVPLIRVHGSMVPLPGGEILTPALMQTILMEIAQSKWESFSKSADIDFAYEIAELSRFRVNYFVDHRGIGAVFRVIPTKILTMEQLGLPKVIKQLCNLTKGLVIVTGPTGSGKSTTLAAILNQINSTRKDHIITIEDPIEFVYPEKKCLVNQREVSRHTKSFKTALRAALREDPDVILIGEMRDTETVETAMETAETGHLVFGTLHTNTAASTVDRVIDMFPADRQSQIRSMLSTTLIGVIAQVLCRKISGGRVAAYEILMSNTAVSNLIREGKTYQLPSIIQSGGENGMRSMSEALFRLIKKKQIEPFEAYIMATEKDDMESKIKSLGLKVSQLLLDEYQTQRNA